MGRPHQLRLRRPPRQIELCLPLRVPAALVKAAVWLSSRLFGPDLDLNPLGTTHRFSGRITHLAMLIDGNTRSSQRDLAVQRSGIPAAPSYARSTPSGGRKSAPPLIYQSRVPTKIPLRHPGLDVPVPAAPPPLRSPRHPTGTSVPSPAPTGAPVLPRTRTRMSEPPPATLTISIPRSSSPSQSDIASVLLAFPIPPIAARTPAKRTAPLSSPSSTSGATPPQSQLPRPKSSLTHLKRPSKTSPTQHGENKALPQINTALAQRASLTVSSPVRKRASTSSLVDVRPVSTHFSPTRPPKSPLPAVPKELPALPQLALLSSSRPLPKINPPSTAPTLSCLIREKVSSRSCTFPLPPSIEPPTPKALSALREDEVEDSFDTPLLGKHTSARSRVSSAESQASSPKGSIRIGSIRAYASCAILARKCDLAEDGRAEHRTSQAALRDSDGMSHSTGDSSEIDMDASLDTSAWRAGVMAKALMAIDSEDDETQAECVKELTRRLSMARQNGSARVTSPQQRRMAHKPYKIVRKVRSHHSDADSGGYTLSEEEENFDLSLDYGSSPSASHKLFSPRSPRSRRSTSSSFGELSANGSAATTIVLQRQSNRETLSQSAFGESNALVFGTNGSPSSKGYIEDGFHHLRPSRSHQSLAGAPEQDFWSPSGHCDRSSGSATSTRFDSHDHMIEKAHMLRQNCNHGLERFDSIGIYNPEHGSTTLRPLRTRSSTSSLKPLATVARLQQGEAGFAEKRFSNMPQLERQTSSPMLRLQTQTLAATSPAPSSAWTVTSRSGSISPTTPLTPSPCSLPTSPSGPLAPVRRVSLKPLRTSQSSSVLCGTLYEEAASTNLKRSSSTSQSSRPPGAGAMASGMVSGTTLHGRRLSRSIPYLSTQNGTAPLILPGLAEAASSSY
ncbi:BQ2448_3106 [Microbotryum intermedium]|uniref:BQ2448_3106 protein n=1 Tax=Microbotryum intermedium TaxID=269621 RepID=A0A238FK24_9BASI|nr:BQ2448_3106 [Microbotryum intermedium]